jgi:hypothetical protein
MEQFLNQYSFLWMAGALLLLVVLLLVRRKSKSGAFVALVVVAAALAGAWLLFRPTQTPLMDDAKKVQSMIGQGMPVLLEFQSPY